MKKYKLEALVSKGTRARKEVGNNVSVVLGESGPYTPGDILDANATKKMVDDVVGGASAALDTLKELGDAIPTKVSQLTNDSGYLTQHQDISGKADSTALNSYMLKAMFDAFIDALGTQMEGTWSYDADNGTFTFTPAAAQL